MEAEDEVPGVILALAIIRWSPGPCQIPICHCAHEEQFAFIALNQFPV